MKAVANSAMTVALTEVPVSQFRMPVVFVIMEGVWYVVLTPVCGCQEPRLESASVRNTPTAHAAAIETGVSVSTESV